MPEPTLSDPQAPPAAPVPPPKPQESKRTNGGGAAPAPPTQAPAPSPQPQKPKAKEPEKIKAVADKAAIALVIGGIEEQLEEWWPILEQHILNTEGEKGGTVSLKISVEPDAEMGLRARIGSGFSGSSLRRTFKAQIRKGKEGRQLELFTA